MVFPRLYNRAVRRGGVLGAAMVPVRAFIGPLLPPCAVPLVVPVLVLPMPGTYHYYFNHSESDLAQYDSGSSSWDGSYTDDYNGDTDEYSDTFSEYGPVGVLCPWMSD